MKARIARSGPFLFGRFALQALCGLGLLPTGSAR
ncbi:hypothetical protein CA606_20265 [Caulobacter vibrioides]|uniref:Uncharacterized protein n=1 Tax=Caulobacter vibrioides TaxID=155892 RepID=A0A2S1B7N8_CAUVI|nr:hypothetical protein CA606_20265 [Caulobacter vibrioides]